MITWKDIQEFTRDKVQWVNETIRKFRVIENSQAHSDYLQKGQEIEEEIKNEIELCKEMIRNASNQRRNQPHKVLKETDCSNDSSRVNQYYEAVLISNTLRSHLLALQRDLENVQFLAVTQATADHTGYRGLAEWAKCSLERHERLLTALAQVSFFGAGITYGTIFSASRGNIDLMCYAFALFCCGFIIPVVSGACLGWASSRPPRTRFATPQTWNGILFFFKYMAMTFITVAICILTVTIFQLRFAVESGGGTQVYIDARPAASMTFICVGIAALSVGIALISHFLVNGWKRVVDAILSRRESGPGLNDYIQV